MSARRFGLLLLLAVAPFALRAQDPGLVVFVNGTVAQASEMNANFAAIAAAIDQLDQAVDSALGVGDQSCPPGEAATGLGASGALLCAAAAFENPIVSTPLPEFWSEPVLLPDCPPGTVVEAVGTRGEGCTIGVDLLLSVGPAAWLPTGIGTTAGGCAPASTDTVALSCECFAVCS